MRNFISTPNLGLKNKLLEYYPIYNLDEYRTSCINYKTDSNLKLPGKNEFMNFKHLEEVLNTYDNLFPNYQNIIGLKSPN